MFWKLVKKFVIFVHFKGFNISQKPKSSPLSYFAQKTSLNLAPNCYPKLKWNARSKLFYLIIYHSSMLWWSSKTLTKLKSQSQKRFNERKYQYLVSIFPKNLSYFAQKTSLNLVPNWYLIIFTCPVQSDSCSYFSNIDIFVH
jgi:hypothetical protein